ncbi:RNA polymerase factor sigma-54 [Marinobacterium sp. AK62]|uniref:RNA polymerase sigma-54 factor n=1 Tax=Marinobacterium alkalitolerans TaxID=1542925 RepID=A0ABS3ZB00_9GAMM|nr:RNA polymerase factor sigma-54 [Marinobacterium alkalitolerans]MBP0048796.1 RNA polymerase factor sigma-54 [Marinobacterium alkalitolerans]
MKQSLQLKIGQQLTMTPQLQQAIRLLQLSSLDLQQEIQEALDSNPLLEADEEHDTGAEAEADSRESASSNETSENASDQDDNWSDDQPDDHWNEQIPAELTTDSSWDDTFQHQPAPAPTRDDDWTPGDNDTVEDSLQDHLLWQLNLTPMSDDDYQIALAIIDSVDNDGYLTTSTEDLLEHFQQQQPDTFGDAELAEIEAVLHRLQQFDPTGVCARNLNECLQLQLQQLPEDTPLRNTAIRLVRDHLNLLGSHDYRTLMRRMRLKETDLQQVITLIQSLNPKPGGIISPDAAQYVIPDVIVRKQHGQWNVSLNQEASPKLKINSQYAEMVRRADNSADNTYLKNHLQEARWFLKSLASRNETLLKVATEIVARQIDFFEEGEEGMKPMVLHDIAEAVDMHESTISRVTTQKFMHTPRGIFELKYFFSSHVGTSDGGAASSTAIRALIKKLVSGENAAKPLSDNKIAQLLKEQGINVARRTVAKYREAMNIPPSNERKRLV